MLEKLNNPLFYIGILSGIKLLLNTLGYNLISDDQVNAIANGIAALVVVIAGIVAKTRNNQVVQENQVLRTKYAQKIPLK
jgi:uncharacterized membrane protein